VRTNDHRDGATTNSKTKMMTMMTTMTTTTASNYCWSVCDSKSHYSHQNCVRTSEIVSVIVIVNVNVATTIWTSAPVLWMRW
jgi:hypothetical protein